MPNIALLTDTTSPRRAQCGAVKREHWMTGNWPPERKLPPGFPLAPIDESGRPIEVGAKVRIVSVASCAQGLPPEDQARLKSYEGKEFEVLEIDRFGMIWFGSDEGGSNFSLKPRELAVI